MKMRTMVEVKQEDGTWRTLALADYRSEEHGVIRRIVRFLNLDRLEGFGPMEEKG